MDDLRTWLEERGSLSVLVFRPSSEGNVEAVWGWEAYDDLLLDFVRRLLAFQTDGIVPAGRSEYVIALAHQRARHGVQDQLIVFDEKYGRLE